MQHDWIFRLATLDDLERIWKMVLQAKDQMHREAKQQWDESYPLIDHIEKDIACGSGFVLCSSDIPIAFGAVLFDGEPAYQTIEGCWLSQQPYSVVHRLVVAEEMKQQGVASFFMNRVEQLSLKKGVHSCKVDTNFDNQRMKRVFEKCGYEYCGVIYYQRGSRLAYEKLF